MVKKRNYSVDFWRFISCIIFILVHVYIVYPTVYWGEMPWINNGKVMFKGSLDVIIIFYLITGYFLMASFKKRKGQLNGEKPSAVKEATNYLMKRVKALYPPFLICLFIGLILTNLYNNIPVAQWPLIAIDSFWEWAGGVVTGLGIGNNFYGLFSDGMHMLMNGPLWFISCLFVVQYLIYFLLMKDEDLFAGLVFPLGFLFAYGYFHLYNTGTMWYVFLDNTSVSQSFLQAFVTIGLGCTFYLIIDAIKDKEVSATGKILLTVANVLASGIVLYHMIWGTPFTFATINGLCCVIVFLSLLQKDYLTDLLNHKIWAYPGKLALYIYMLHFPIIGCLHKFVGITNLHVVCLTTYAIVVVLSILLSLLMDKVITPKLNSKA